MRIVIAGPPKTGSMGLECLMGRAYGLRWLPSFETLERPDLQSSASWLTANRFPNGTIFHRHYDYAPEIADALDAVPALLATIVRDPFDAFVSTYYTLQQPEDGILDYQVWWSAASDTDRSQRLRDVLHQTIELM